MDTTPLFAYCWASGLIGFGATVPNGAIEIAHGDAKRVRALIKVTARPLARHKLFFVPGVPESTNQRAKGDVLGAWLLWIKDYEVPGLTVAVANRGVCKFNPFYAGSFTGDSSFYLMADDRLRLVKAFNVHQCRSALRVRGLQKTVRAAIERRIRVLERAEVAA